MDSLPSRRVKALLRIIDTMHSNAVRIFEEKKTLVESREKADDEEEKGKDLTTLFRTSKFHYLYKFLLMTAPKQFDRESQRGRAEKGRINGGGAHRTALVCNHMLSPSILPVDLTRFQDSYIRRNGYNFQRAHAHPRVSRQEP